MKYRSIITLVLLASGCSKTVVIEQSADETCFHPSSPISSLAALQVASCILPSTSDAVLVAMNSHPAIATENDGRAGWRFRFTERTKPSLAYDVDVAPDEFLLVTGGGNGCLEDVVPFDSTRVLEQAVDLLPKPMQVPEGRSIHISKTSSCADPAADSDQLTHLMAQDTQEPHEYYLAQFDDSDELVAYCGPCSKPDALACGCAAQ